jgi:hypothetical protein
MNDDKIQMIKIKENQMNNKIFSKKDKLYSKQK